MIVFNLMCKDCSSEFEGWFSNSKSCDTQIKQKLVECVICNSSNIEKALSRPNAVSYTHLTLPTTPYV